MARPKAKIRSFKADDQSQVIALWQSCKLITSWNDPLRDIALAKGGGASEILVAERAGKLEGSVMVGHDGHRAWVYYLAVAPEAAGQGLGLLLMTAAENWARTRGVAKLQLMVRPGNLGVKRFYLRGGYRPNPCHIMQKWLEPSGQPQIEGADEKGRLTVTITYLEMTTPPAEVPHPTSSRRLTLLQVHSPTLTFYRFLYDKVGEPWLWYERRMMSDEALLAAITKENVEIFVLHVDGVPAGYFELDFSDPETAELAYFGLMPEFLGQGLGPWLLHEALSRLWSRGHRRVITNTCSLDHPRALANYQRLGFSPYAQKEILIDDPRLTGVIPSDVVLAQQTGT